MRKRKKTTADPLTLDLIVNFMSYVTSLESKTITLTAPDRDFEELYKNLKGLRKSDDSAQLDLVGANFSVKIIRMEAK